MQGGGRKILRIISVEIANQKQTIPIQSRRNTEKNVIFSTAALARISVSRSVSSPSLYVILPMICPGSTGASSESATTIWLTTSDSLPFGTSRAGFSVVSGSTEDCMPFATGTFCSSGFSGVAIDQLANP